MPKAAKPKAAEPEEELTLPLSVEVRRQRVAAVRGLDRDLEQVENSLRDALARLPGLLDRVARARTVIATNTAPVSPESGGDD